MIDLYSRRVVGWAMSNRPDTDLVTDALVVAFGQRRPDRRVVHHSDRGAIYTSLAFSHRLAERGLAQSFGSTGDAYDNAAVEAFWATLKRELAWIHQRTTWDTRAELRTAVFDYTQVFYNPEHTNAASATTAPLSTRRSPPSLELPCPTNRGKTRWTTRPQVVRGLAVSGPARLGVVLGEHLGAVALALGDHADVEAVVEQLARGELPQREDRAVEHGVRRRRSARAASRRLADATASIAQRSLRPSRSPMAA